MTVQVVVDALNSVLLKVTPLLLNLLYALILILIGWLIAKGLQWLVVYVLKAVQLDKGAEAIKLSTLLKKGEVRRSTSELIGDLVYWLVVFVVAVATVSALGLTAASPLLNAILAYTPKVIAAAFVLALAVLIGALVAGIVLVVLNNLELANAKTLAKIVQNAVIIFGGLVALEQLGIPIAWITAVFGSIVLGAVGLAIAIAFGLGCKDMAADWLSGIFKK